MDRDAAWRVLYGIFSAPSKEARAAAVSALGPDPVLNATTIHTACNLVISNASQMRDSMAGYLEGQGIALLSKLHAEG